MSEKPPLSDDEVYERIHAALLALGRGDGATVRGDTTFKAARKALSVLQLGLLVSMENGTEVNAAIKGPDETSTRPPSDPR
jgi:hypothetical protein